MKAPCRILVAGGGPVGLLQTALLAPLGGVEVTVLDPGAAPVASKQPGFRVYALSRASERVLSSVGAWAAIAPRAAPYERMVVWESSPQTAELCFDAAETGEPNLGHIVDHERVCFSLYECLVGLDNVDLRYDCCIDSLCPEQRELTSGDGARHAWDLIIGADGGRSCVREAYGVATQTWSYEQRAIVAHVTSERGHRHTAWQRFLTTGPLALLPLVNGNCGLVWSVDNDQSQRLLDCAPDEFNTALTDASQAALGQLTLASERAAFPLRLLHAKQYVAAGMALVGDAAHTVHPLAGQGLNLGMLDAAALAQVIGEAMARNEYPGDRRVLRRYARWRRQDNLTMSLGLDLLHRVFQLRAPWFAPLRRAGMSAIGNTALAKRVLMARAMGLSGDLPAAARRAV